jgi:hypothetical protein
MKQETNNEMDLLLRRLGRRDSGSVRDTGAQTDEQHLDADELSSYAQKALPPTARARYTEHLAECTSCRKLVTELSLSLGATTVAAPVQTVPVPRGLKKFLASLFSPMVLRYAVPALGVIVVMVVGFVVLRQRRSERFVARLNEELKPASAPVNSGSPATEPSPLRGFTPSDKEAENPPQRDQGVTSPSGTKPQSGPVEKREAGASTPPAKEETIAAEPQPVTAATPASPAAPKVQVEDEAKKTDATRQPARQTVTVATADGEFAKAQSNEAGNSNFQREPIPLKRTDKEKAKTSDSVGFMGGGVRSAAGPGAASATRRRAEDAKDAKDDGETRSVAGRRFRKERGIWTDTAYDSSTATVNVARGSEQFRALVADEPDIDTIAKQLDGEVIVVWKGRAYRIR